jgi:ParB-like nuclease domain
VALAARIELWPIDRLRPYERNPRTHSDAQVDQIAASMVEFGWTNPVLVDEQGGILAGHGRLLAARKLGLTEVPVIRFERPRPRSTSPPPGALQPAAPAGGPHHARSGWYTIAPPQRYTITPPFTDLTSNPEPLCPKCG